MLIRSVRFMVDLPARFMGWKPYLRSGDGVW